MKELCIKQGCGVCCDCTDIYKTKVLCRNNIAKHVDYMQDTIEEMIQYMFRHCDRFDNKYEVLEYFDINDIYEADNYYRT